MKLLILSDTHGYQPIIRKIFEKIRSVSIDALVVPGDLTDFGSLQLAEKMLKELNLLGVPILFVPGNCDPIGLVKLENANSAINIHGRCKKVNNSIFIGVGGSTQTPFNTPFELSETDIGKTLCHAYDCMDKKDRFILVAHTPPVNTAVDITMLGEHVGSKTLRDFIEEKKPVAVFCGHIHEARGICWLGESLIVNPGPAHGGLYSIVEINGNAIAEMHSL